MTMNSLRVTLVDAPSTITIAAARAAEEAARRFLLPFRARTFRVRMVIQHYDLDGSARHDLVPCDPPMFVTGLDLITPRWTRELMLVARMAVAIAPGDPHFRMGNVDNEVVMGYFMPGGERVDGSAWRIDDGFYVWDRCAHCPTVGPVGKVTGVCVACADTLKTKATA